MNTNELANLPLPHRLQAMEVLWDSLCRDAAYDRNPDWHGEVLVERTAEIEAGKSEGWEEAKARVLAGAKSIRQQNQRA